MVWFLIFVAFIIIWTRVIDWVERREERKWQDHKRLERLEYELQRRWTAEDQARAQARDREFLRRSTMRS